MCTERDDELSPENEAKFVKWELKYRAWLHRFRDLYFNDQKAAEAEMKKEPSHNDSK